MTVQSQNQGFGGPERPPEPRYLAVGRVARPFGLRGELKVKVLTDYPERLDRFRTVYLGPQAEPWTVEGLRLHQSAALFKLSGCDDRDAAEALRDMLVQIPLEDAVPLEEGEYYEHQVVGLAVVEQDGTALGKVREILSTGANDVYIVVGPEGELLLPAIEPVILEIDLQAGRMVVEVLEGLR